MPVRRYSGKTYVAFMDISGFKEMMKKEDRAKKALDKFYGTTYDVVRHQRELPEVNAIAVSDCAVLFSLNRNLEQDKIDGLSSILRFIQEANRKLIDPRVYPPIMTTCSIAFGRFRYEDRIEFDGLAKDYFIGWPYVKALLDNENGKPKIQPGECRLLKENLSLARDFQLPQNPPLSLMDEKRNHYYFYWMLDDLDDLKRFKKEYEDTYQLKFTGMISVLQKYAGIRSIGMRR